MTHARKCGQFHQTSELAVEFQPLAKAFSAACMIGMIRH
jgi:hypothetical protein